LLSLKVRKGLLVLSYDFDDCKEWVMCSGIKNMPFFLAGIHPKRVAHGLIVVILKLSMLNNMAWMVSMFQVKSWMMMYNKWTMWGWWCTPNSSNNQCITPFSMLVTLSKYLSF